MTSAANIPDTVHNKKEIDDLIERSAILCKQIFDSVSVQRGPAKRKDWKNNKDKANMIVDNYLLVSNYINETEFTGISGISCALLSKLLRARGHEPKHNSFEARSARIRSINNKRSTAAKQNNEAPQQAQVLVCHEEERCGRGGDVGSVREEKAEDLPSELPICKENLQVEQQPAFADSITVTMPTPVPAPDTRLTTTTLPTPVTDPKINPMFEGMWDILPNGDIIIKKILVRGSEEHSQFIKNISVPKQFQFTKG